MNINEDIRVAETLPASFYSNEALFSASKEKIFASGWQIVHTAESLRQKGDTLPFTLFPSFLDEPLLISRQDNENLICMSNVCTHRGNLLIKTPGRFKNFICDYHGRKFSLDGKFESMPEFNDAKNFPRDCDDLHRLDLVNYDPFSFISLKPEFDIRENLEILSKYTGFLKIEQSRYAHEFSKEYLVNAHWALYCDNYLEGFHIPFVHPELNKILDYKSYQSFLFNHSNLQLGIADSASDAFILPNGHICEGQRVGAFYFWLFPNIMLNFYPWGLSLNIVNPISVKQCKVSFLTFITDEEKFASGAANLLDKVEREDEFVVENVQKGLRSRYYTTGRFSPAREKGVHHFHRLISKYMS